MKNNKGWESVRKTKNGVSELKLRSWRKLYDYLVQNMLDYPHYIWRGQRDSTWALESSLERLLRDKNDSDKAEIFKAHLDKFKMSIRGRRGTNPNKITRENEWWALGQHHGLATPLLDWTESAFFALYFAFEKKEGPANKMRSIWAIADVSQIDMPYESDGEVPALDIVRPSLDENLRLVAQAGLFTRAPVGLTVEQWVQKKFKGIDDKSVLKKFLVPDEGREDCLKTLNRMSINHLTLFPDLYGSAKHCNKALEIDNY